MKRISLEQVQTSERFYKIPKAFTEVDKYKKMSVDAKYMYALLKDRLLLLLGYGIGSIKQAPHIKGEKKEASLCFE